MSSEARSTGKRAGARRGAKQSTTVSKGALGLVLAITLSVVAWGYLVWLAIDFGSAARGGDSAAWAFLAVACVGAAACLFIGLLLIVRLLRALGILGSANQQVPTPGRRIKT